MSNKSALSRQVGGDHYKHFAQQPIILCNSVAKVTGNFALATMFKYLARYPFKGQDEQDLQKALHCYDLGMETLGASFHVASLKNAVLEFCLKNDLPMRQTYLLTTALYAVVENDRYDLAGLIEMEIDRIDTNGVESNVVESNVVESKIFKPTAIWREAATGRWQPVETTKAGLDVLLFPNKELAQTYADRLNNVKIHKHPRGEYVTFKDADTFSVKYGVDYRDLYHPTN